MTPLERAAPTLDTLADVAAMLDRVITIPGIGELVIERALTRWRPGQRPQDAVLAAVNDLFAEARSKRH